MSASGTVLENLVEIVGGGTPSKTIARYYDGDIPWVTPKDMKAWLISDAIDHISEEAVANSAAKMIPTGAVLVVIRSGVLKHRLPVAITERPVAINQDMKALLCGDRIHPPYLARFLSASQRVLLSGVRATTADNLPLDLLKRLKIPLPPLPEPRRIAAILDKADAGRRKRQQTLELADQFLRSAFLDLFGDPVTNPKGWPVKKLGDVGELDRGKSRHRPRNDPILLGGPYPLIQTGDVANSGGVILTHTQTYSEEGLRQSRMWKAGTLCITIAANIANTAILAFDACFPDSVVGFSPGEGIATEYVQGWFEFLRPILELRAPQVAQKNINLRILRGLDIPIPPAELQAMYATSTGELRNHKVILRRGREALEKLAGSLTQRAFRGEL
jgi:type I restriction enzyme S subunit